MAISKENLAKLEKSPSTFKPSVEIAKSDLQPPSPDHVVVPDKLKLFPGTTVFMSTSFAYLVIEDRGEDLKVATPHLPSHLQTMHRRNFIIHKDDISQLSQPGAEKKLATKLSEIQASNRGSNTVAVPFTLPGFPPGITRPAMNYPIRLVIPNDYERVTKDTPLEVGTRCMLVWGSGWNNATITKLRENGDPEIQWEGWPTVEPVTRDSLIVSKAVAGQLRAKTTKNAKPSKKPGASTVASKPNNKKTDDANDGDLIKYKLTLESAGAKKISVTKVIMEITGLSLADAKEVADEIPIDLKNDLSKADAERWKNKFETAGATVKITALQPSEPSNE